MRAAASVEQHRPERRLVGQPARTVHLHCPIDHVVQRARREELQQRHLDPRLRSRVDLPRRVHRQQAAGLDLGRRVGDPALHDLLLGERTTEGLTLERVGAHQLEGALHLPEPSHHVVDAAGPEPLLRQPEPVPHARRARSRRHARAGEAHLAVRPPSASRVTEHGHRPHDLDAGRVGRDEDHRGAPVRLRIRVGDGHHDREPRAVGAGGEPLVRVDDPLVAVERRACRAAWSDPSRSPRARSSRRTSARRRRRAAAGTCPSGRPCRTGAAARRSPRPAPGSRARAAP